MSPYGNLLNPDNELRKYIPQQLLTDEITEEVTSAAKSIMTSSLVIAMGSTLVSFLLGASLQFLLDKLYLFQHCVFFPALNLLWPGNVEHIFKLFLVVVSLDLFYPDEINEKVFDFTESSAPTLILEQYGFQTSNSISNSGSFFHMLVVIGLTCVVYLTL